MCGLASMLFIAALAQLGFVPASANQRSCPDGRCHNDAGQSLLQRRSILNKSVVAAIPPKCQRLMRRCGMERTSIGSLQTWAEANASFELCCLGGGHDEAVCSSVAGEAFAGHSGHFAPDATFCLEVTALEDAHDLWQEEETIQVGALVELRTQRLARRMVELSSSMPDLVNKLVDGVAVAAGGLVALAIGSHGSAKPSHMALVGALALISTKVKECDEESFPSWCEKYFEQLNEVYFVELCQKHHDLCVANTVLTCGSAGFKSSGRKPCQFDQGCCKENCYDGKETKDGHNQGCPSGDKYWYQFDHQEQCCWKYGDDWFEHRSTCGAVE